MWVGVCVCKWQSEVWLNNGRDGFSHGQRQKLSSFMGKFESLKRKGLEHSNLVYPSQNKCYIRI